MVFAMGLNLVILAVGKMVVSMVLCLVVEMVAY